MPDAPDEHPTLLYIEDERGIAGAVSLHFGSDEPFSQSIVQSYGLEPFRAVLADRQMALGAHLITRPDVRGTSAWHKLQWGIATNQLGRGLEVTFVNCEVHMLNFYQRLGYRPYKPAVEGYPGSVMLVPLVLIGGDFDYLKRIESPIFAMFGETMGTPAIAERLVPLLNNPPLVSAGAAPSEDYLALVESKLAAVGERQDLFADLTREEIGRALGWSHVLDLPQGSSLIVGGKHARTVFVVLEGQLDVSYRGHTLLRATTGDVLGELAFLLDAVRSADVRVASPSTRVLCLTEKSLKNLADSHPRGAAKLWLNLSKTLARRVVSTTKLLP